MGARPVSPEAGGGPPGEAGRDGPLRPDAEDYVLGHSARELDRLDNQGALYRAFTRELFVEAGLAPGHRVLDLGSGSGDVAFLAHELVARSGGEVVGLERDPSTVAAARARATHKGLDRVRFVEASLDAPPTELSDESPFDAVVGRFILMHQPDPAAVLRAARVHARPGAAVAFLESSMTSLTQGVHSLPFSPLYDRIVRWKSAVVRGSGADLEAGLRLRRVFLDAGLPEPRVRFHAHVEGGENTPWYAYIQESVTSMLPRARDLGIDGFDEASVATLAADLRSETVASRGVLVGWPVVAAWCRIA